MQMLIAIGNLTELSRKPSAAVEVLKEGTRLNGLFTKDTFTELVSCYEKHRESFVIHGKPLATKLKNFVADFNEFPNISKLANELKEKPQKVASEKGQAIMAQDPKGFVVEELDERASHGCGDPNCEIDHTEIPMLLPPTCHPNMPVHATYWKGTLQLVCAVCGGLVSNIKVADE